MSTTNFIKTMSVSQFKSEMGATQINLKRSESGKPFAITDNGVDIKVSPAAELAAVSAPETLRVSYCSDEQKEFFMLHVKRDDNSPVIVSL
jgi:hypothetical protein